jgi:integrase
MAKKLTKTSTPGIYRRHVKDCLNHDGSKRCSCSYAVPTRHRGKQSMETFRTFEEAREAKGRNSAGDTRPSSKEKFGSYFETWIETYAGRTKRGFEEETRTEYRRAIENDAVPRWADLRVSDIGPGDVRKLYAEMGKAGKSAAAMKKIKGALSPLFATAIEDELIRSNPISGVRIPTPPPSATDSAAEGEERGKALTREELATFLAVVREDWRFFFEFLTVTGLRIGEAVGLTWENVVVGGDKPRIKVREQIYEGKRKRYLKSDAGKRDIPLTPEWSKRLLAHRRDTYQGPKAPVFATRPGKPLRPSNIYRRALAPAAIAAGLYVEVPDEKEEGGLRKKTAIAFHAFRHTCASLLFDEGRNVKQVSEWLGHTDPSFTLRVYIHLLDDGLGAGIELPVVAPDDAAGLHGVDPGVDPAKKSKAGK